MVLAIDLGGSYLRVAEVNGSKLKNRVGIDTPKNKGDILDAIVKLISKYKNYHEIGLGVAGFVKDGKTIKTPHLDFSGVSIQSFLEKKFKVKVKVDNDARCAGIAEMRYGAGKGKKNVVVVTVGTGIGGAIFVDGKLYYGNGAAGEIGHMFLSENEFEQLASGTAFNEMVRDRYFGELAVSELYDRALKGDTTAKGIYKDIGKNLGTGLLDLLYILDPEMVIIGGGFSDVEVVIKEAARVIKEKDIFKKDIPILRAYFGPDAGLIGAGNLFDIKK